MSARTLSSPESASMAGWNASRTGCSSPASSASKAAMAASVSARVSS